jgi:hypothetical protein
VQLQLPFEPHTFRSTCSRSMVLKVAIAGATSKALGEHISRAFAERTGDFDVTLLVRKSTLVRPRCLTVFGCLPQCSTGASVNIICMHFHDLRKQLLSAVPRARIELRQHPSRYHVP